MKESGANRNRHGYEQRWREQAKAAGQQGPHKSNEENIQ
jgi:hypothetical protein